MRFICPWHLFLTGGLVRAQVTDRHDAVECAVWANSGECERNAAYMQEHCAASCIMQQLTEQHFIRDESVSVEADGEEEPQTLEDAKERLQNVSKLARRWKSEKNVAVLVQKQLRVAAGVPYVAVSSDCQACLDSRSKLEGKVKELHLELDEQKKQCRTQLRSQEEKHKEECMAQLAAQVEGAQERSAIVSIGDELSTARARIVELENAMEAQQSQMRTMTMQEAQLQRQLRDKNREVELTAKKLELATEKLARLELEPLNASQPECEALMPLLRATAEEFRTCAQNSSAQEKQLRAAIVKEEQAAQKNVELEAALVLSATQQGLTYRRQVLWKRRSLSLQKKLSNNRGAAIFSERLAAERLSSLKFELTLCRGAVTDLTRVSSVLPCNESVKPETFSIGRGTVAASCDPPVVEKSALSCCRRMLRWKRYATQSRRAYPRHVAPLVKKNVASFTNSDMRRDRTRWEEEHIGRSGTIEFERNMPTFTARTAWTDDIERVLNNFGQHSPLVVLAMAVLLAVFIMSIVSKMCPQRQDNRTQYFFIGDERADVGTDALAAQSFQGPASFRFRPLVGRSRPPPCNGDVSRPSTSSSSRCSAGGESRSSRESIGSEDGRSAPTIEEEVEPCPPQRPGPLVGPIISNVEARIAAAGFQVQRPVATPLTAQRAYSAGSQQKLPALPDALTSPAHAPRSAVEGQLEALQAMVSKIDAKLEAQATNISAAETSARNSLAEHVFRDSMNTTCSAASEGTLSPPQVRSREFDVKVVRDIEGKAGFNIRNMAISNLDPARRDLCDLKNGDVILKVNRIPVGNIDEYREHAIGVNEFLLTVEQFNVDED